MWLLDNGQKGIVERIYLDGQTPLKGGKIVT